MYGPNPGATIANHGRSQSAYCGDHTLLNSTKDKRSGNDADHNGVSGTRATRIFHSHSVRTIGMAKLMMFTSPSAGQMCIMQRRRQTVSNSAGRSELNRKNVSQPCGARIANGRLIASQATAPPPMTFMAR